MERFAGQIALVTGAARGIGLASSTRLATEGATVYLTDIDADAVASAAGDLRARGLAAEARVLDVADEDSVDAVFTEVADRHDGLDVVHAHAGILLPAQLGDETRERFERTLAVNVTGVFLTARAAAAALRRRGGGAIVLTGSTAGIVAEPDFLGYCTSKAAVNHMARQLALDLVGWGIRVNAVCPGWIDTDFNRELIAGWSAEELGSAVADLVPMARQGSPEEVAACVAFLASREASYVTGHTLVVDGGITIR